MSDDARSGQPKGPRKNLRPRILVVNNPGSGSSSEDEKIVNNTYSSYGYQPSGHPSSSQSLLLDRPSQAHSHIPAPLTTDLPPEHRICYPSSRSNPSNPALSSPSSTSSPAVESTPPPSTPGQGQPPVDLTGEATFRRDYSQPLTQDRPETAPYTSSGSTLFDRFRSPLQRSVNGGRVSSRPATSPTTSIPETFLSPTSAGYRGHGEKVTLLVTADAETLKTVDITGARDAAFIRERIFTKLQISDDDQTPFSIYRTEIGEYAIGEALTDDQLFELYRNSGDDKGTIKLLVSHSHAPVHEPPSEASLVSPTVNTIPPPVLPQQALFAPLRPRRPPSKSRRGSMSSTSERMPQDVVAAGYEASVSDDLDHGDREIRRSTIRPPPHQQQTVPLPQPPRPRSPSSYARPQSPTLLMSPERMQANSESHHSAARAERGHGTALPTPPLQQVLSPDNNRFADETTAGSTYRHNRAGSDAVMDRERERNMVLDHQTESERQRRAYLERDTKEREDRERSRRKEAQPRKESALRRKNAHYDADNEQHRRRGEPWTVVPQGIPSSDYKKERPTTPQDARPTGSPRYQATTSGFPLNIPHHPRGPAPPTPGEQSRHSKRQGKAVPPTWAIAWRGAGPSKNEPKPAVQSPPSPWHTRMMAKSMSDLRGTYNKQSQPSPVPSILQPGRTTRPTPPSLPIARPSTGSSSTSINNSAAETMSPYHDISGYTDVVPSQYESRPVQSPSSAHHNHSPRPANGTGYSAGMSPAPSYLSVNSPNDPYPRPRSAQDSEPATPPPPHRPSGQSPRAGDFSSSSSNLRSPAHYYGSGLTTNSSTSSYEDYNTFVSSRPHPIRVDADFSPQHAIRPPTTPRSPVTSMGPPGDTSFKDGDRRTPPELPVQRTLSSLPVREDESSENTVRRDDFARLVGALGNQSTTVVAKPRTPSPSRSARTSDLSTPSSGNTVVNFPTIDDEDSDSEGGGTIWAKKPDRSGQSSQAPWQRPPPIPKPNNSGRPVLAPISTDSSPASGPTALPEMSRDSSRPPLPDYIPHPPIRSRKPNSNGGGKRLQDQRTSRFDNNFDYTWAPRPPPEEVFDNLQEYFPEHDVDKPVIEAASGGTSPTSAEPTTLVPVPEGRRFRHKKSIRVVAAEHKRRVDRTSHMEPTVQAQLRKRNTKLWGSRLEEVTSEEAKEELSATAEASPGGAKPIFRWVRGELIGKGTYGKVYLALNATTGEMIAVKQVEMPRTASDRDDSRQITVVEALKLESETLKDLDHPHIVQYLGFEETPTFLSIFLEYVPGGSIASCLRKHGKFDEEVTKSFTSQILGGLEYLHSKGILHRDLKADNILVETSGICKISDFGISKRTDDINMAGAYTSMQGTVFWMAPEVINSQKKGYNSKIDIWSVGCVVYEMWSGQRPWNGQEAMAVLLHLYQTRQGPPVPPDITLSPLADEFRQLCFAMDPDERPTASELQRHPYLVLQPDWTFNGFK